MRPKNVAKLIQGTMAGGLLAIVLLPSMAAATAEERVDEQTQAALSMDAHPLRGEQISL